MRNKMNILGNIYCYGAYYMKENCKNGKVLYCGSGEINDCLSRHLYFLKRGLYLNTNKAILQEKYDKNELSFEVLHESESKENYKNMSDKEKESLQKAMSVLEQFYIDLYKDTICNCQMTVKRHSSNRDKLSTIKRHNANIGSKNPNARYSEKIISSVLWLKQNGYKPKEISKIIEDNYKIDIKKTYISSIGVQKWIHLEPSKPDFIKDVS